VTPPPDVDGDLPQVAEKWAQRHRELDEATQSVVSGATDAGHALALGGDLLRRREALGDTTRDVGLALDRIEAQAAHAYVETINADAEREKLVRAIDEAFEAILEDGEERTLFMHSAEAALFARDALESVRVAMTHQKLDAGKLEAKLAQIDKDLSKQARLLVALNAMRRRETAALDTSERTTAWWFSARASCDFLMSLYRTEDNAPGVHVTAKHNAAHLAVCEACQRDVEAGSLAYTPQHIAASSLWRREHGIATADETAVMESHAKSCKDCKRALDASAVSLED
jgi:hypothetical protein